MRGTEAEGRVGVETASGGMCNGLDGWVKGEGNRG